MIVVVVVVLVKFEELTVVFTDCVQFFFVFTVPTHKPNLMTDRITGELLLSLRKRRIVA